MATYHEVTACRLCDSADLTEALNLGETPLANELDGTELFPLVVNRCGRCGHHQLSIAVAPERLWGPSYPYASGTSPVWREHLSKLADEVAALKPGGRVLEIGSNDGTLIKMLAGRGLRAAIGLDPSGPIEARETYRLRQVSWPTDDRSYGLGKPFDIILALHVFAHVDDLHGFTAAVKEALAPDGVFIVEGGSFDVIYGEHLSMHHEAPLHPFFARHGLRITKARRNKAQGGSLRCYVAHA
jgi:novobiocin biosynthesis protein NovU/D-mycarose 3-C-methyltransferase